MTRPPLAAIRPALLAALAILLAHLPADSAEPDVPVPTIFGGRPSLDASDAGDAALTATWYQRLYTKTGVARRKLTTVEGGAPVYTVELPGRAEFYCRPQRRLGAWDLLHVDLLLPTQFPAETLIYVWVKDWDTHWYQALPVRPQDKVGRIRLTVPLRGAAATAAWQPGGHFRPWHQMSADQIGELGVKFAAPTGTPIEWTGEVILAGMSLERLPLEKQPQPRVRDFRVLTAAPQVGSPLEFAVELDHLYRDPFSRESVDLQAEVVDPNGTSKTIHAFYFEDFLFDEAADDTFLQPSGTPQFRVRYTPLTPGEHTVTIKGTVAGTPVALPAVTIDAAAAPPEWKGFIRPSETDTRLLSYSYTGEDFNGIGINVRSPYDTRYMEAFAFSDWRMYNLTMYKHLFARYHAAGINMVEVWMSPWWLALEWMPDAPGNHGVGHYNQYRAWQLDRLFQWAEEYDIKLILVFNNHGKFSSWCDQDWERNPYNTARGGLLESPEDYFRDEVAKASAKQLLDYIAARWGHEPNLLAWKLFTEIDLTGKNGEWYKNDAVRTWHRDMANHLHKVDPNDHIVTTHWSTSYKKVNRPLASLDELDMLTLDIYYDGTGAKRLWDFMQQTVVFADEMNKPSIITEFGGSPWADSLDHIRNQLHIALWSGWFGVMATPPCFWWFPLVEEQDLYGDYRALANFVEGESRHGAERSRRVVTGTHLIQMGLTRGKDHLYWLFDTEYFFAGDLNKVADRYEELEVPVTQLSAGDYEVEIWNPTTGDRIQKSRITIEEDGQTRLTLPPFEKDIAIKLIHVP